MIFFKTSDQNDEQDMSPKIRLSKLLTEELRNTKDSYETVVKKVSGLLDTVIQPHNHVAAQNQQNVSVPFLQDVSKQFRFHIIA